MYKFNLNDKIYFSLTDKGKKRLSEPYFAASVHWNEESGLYETQAWVFCNLFGEGLRMGFVNEVCPSVYFDESHTRTERSIPNILKNQCIIMKALQLILQTGKYRGSATDRMLEELSIAILESEPESACSIDDIPDE